MILKEFAAVNVTIWGIPGYFFCAGVSTVLASCVFIVLATEKGYSPRVNLDLLGKSGVLAIFSARLFGGLSGIYREIGLGKTVSWESVLNTGIVFYGGLLGMLVSFCFLSRRRGQDDLVLDLFAVVIPLFHSVARVGCFLGGCCFGTRASGSFSIVYTCFDWDHIETASRIPIQLVEAAFNMCIFAYLLCLACSPDWEHKGILRQYLAIYSVGRFCLEFYRGDAVHGIVHGVSFSQMISVMIWVALILSSDGVQKGTSGGWS